jgi:HD-GYP domain-containing protein (c-di-GMP phosphodiesterase class II)
MAEENRRGDNSVIHEINKKFRLSFSVVTFVIVILFIVIIRYIFEPLADYISFLPKTSVTLITVIVFFLTLMGLFLFLRISKQVIRIIKDYSNRLERILSITSDLREEAYGDILLEKIADAAKSMTRSDAVSILMLDDDSLVFKVAKGENAAGLAGTAVGRGKGIAGWVADNGRPLRVADVSKDSRFDPNIDVLSGSEAKSVLCVPLQTRSGIIGVLELLNGREGHPYRGRDEEIIMYLAGQAAISIIKTQFVEDQKNYEIHITEMLLEAIDFHMPEKKGHSRRVAMYSNMIAKSLDMPESEKKRLYFASLLHDVGFLKIHADNSFKKEEFMKHPVVGYEMIKPINFYADIASFILHHHERYDGFGYPSRLKGAIIPLESRIIAIAEAFDAMVSDTSYRVPLSASLAMEELKRNAGTQFDPALVEKFIEALELQYQKDSLS